jgi:arylsulfatase A-like enzyme
MSFISPPVMRIRHVLAWSVVLSATIPTTFAAPPPLKPNVIFVLVDDLGYADVGAYGATDIATPNIDRLAREGVKFTDFYANAPVCTPTRCAFLTGRWQQRTGFEWALGLTGELKVRRGDDWLTVSNMLELGLPTTEPSIARQLKNAGYATGCIGKWHLGYKPEYGPNAHGFDEYFGNLLGLADYYAHTYVNGTTQMRENEQPVEVNGYLTDLYNARAVQFIERHAEKPFFLYVPYNAVHFPFQPPDRPDSRMDAKDWYAGTRADYARMVERVDRGVGEMLAALEKAGILDETLLIFSSDNGGERLSDNRPLFNHKQSLWEGGIRVPCLVRWPRGLPQGLVTNQPAITMDLTATILSACGSAPDQDRPLDGIDLLPLLRGEQPQQERTFYWRVARKDRYQKAVRHGRWKYVLDGALPLLFDLESDPGERTDLGFRHPEKLRELEALLAAWEMELAKTPPPVSVR